MMDDLISRQAAIDVLERVDWYHQDKNLKMVHGANDDEHQAWYKAEDVYKAINIVPSAQSEQRWIPCSERLPETSGSYLVSGMWESGRVAVGDCEYSSYDGYFNTAWNFDVLAWMPLPEPYEAERKEE